MTDNWAVFGLPRDLWHCQLSNFEWEKVRPQRLPQEIEGFLQRVKEGESPHLLLTGDPGIGKSHLGVGVYRRAISMFGSQLVTWINVPQFCTDVRNSYGKPWDPFEDYREARRLVVLDDLLGRELSRHEISQILYDLIDIAYRNHAAMLVSSNPAVEELAGYLKAHEVSRLLGDATVIPMTADRDYRIG